MPIVLRAGTGLARVGRGSRRFPGLVHTGWHYAEGHSSYRAGAHTSAAGPLRVLSTILSSLTNGGNPVRTWTAHKPCEAEHAPYNGLFEWTDWRLEGDRD